MFILTFLASGDVQSFKKINMDIALEK